MYRYQPIRIECPNQDPSPNKVETKRFLGGVVMDDGCESQMSLDPRDWTTALSSLTTDGAHLLAK